MNTIPYLKKLLSTTVLLIVDGQRKHPSYQTMKKLHEEEVKSLTKLKVSKLSKKIKKIEHS